MFSWRMTAMRCSRFMSRTSSDYTTIDEDNRTLIHSYRTTRTFAAFSGVFMMVFKRYIRNYRKELHKRNGERFLNIKFYT